MELSIVNEIKHFGKDRDQELDFDPFELMS